MGLSSVMVMVKTFSDGPEMAGKKPLKIGVPLDKGTHGLSKLDCTTEWFPLRNQNVTFSPTLAVKLSGSKTKPPSPTWTS